MEMQKKIAGKGAGDERFRRMMDIKHRIGAQTLARFYDEQSEDRPDNFIELWQVGKAQVMVYFIKARPEHEYSIYIYEQEARPSSTFEETEARLAALAETQKA